MATIETVLAAGDFRRITEYRGDTMTEPTPDQTPDPVEPKGGDQPDVQPNPAESQPEQ